MNDPTPPAAASAAPWVLYLERPAGTDPSSMWPVPRVLAGPAEVRGVDPLQDVDPADPAAVAVAIATGMAAGSTGSTDAELYLALDTALCFSAEVGTEDLPRRDRRAVLKYRFEDRLPLPLEEVEADFADLSGGGGAGPTLAVAVPTAWLAALCAALVESGVRVAAISPTSLLGAQAVLQNALRPPGADADLLLVHTGVPGSLVAVEAVVLAPRREASGPERPAGWFGFAPASEGGGPGTRARMLIERLAAARGRPLRVWAAPGIGRDLLAGLCDHPDVAQLESLRWPAGGGRPPPRPWIDLRRGELDPARAGRDTEQWRRWSVAAMLLLTLLTAGVWLRGTRYAGSQSDAEARLAAVYRRVAGPRGPVPASPGRALRSVLGERQASQGADRGVSGAWAHERFFNALRALPDDGSVRVMRLAAGPDTVELVTQTADHLTADRIAAALSGSGATRLEFSVDRATAGDDASGVTADLIGRAPGSGGARE